MKNKYATTKPYFLSLSRVAHMQNAVRLALKGACVAVTARQEKKQEKNLLVEIWLLLAAPAGKEPPF